YACIVVDAGTVLLRITISLAVQLASLALRQQVSSLCFIATRALKSGQQILVGQQHRLIRPY
ncbi:hypothetical protein, partial [Sphingomonas sp.]|uniref:hypothetical protein n=1 Tax=Sphingomonas sp. TaxID=28214 RepID=UPI0025DAA280